MEGYIKESFLSQPFPWWRLEQPSGNVGTGLSCCFGWLVRTYIHFEVQLRMSFQKHLILVSKFIFGGKEAFSSCLRLWQANILAHSHADRQFQSVLIQARIQPTYPLPNVVEIFKLIDKCSRPVRSWDTSSIAWGSCRIFSKLPPIVASSG